MALTKNYHHSNSKFKVSKILYRIKLSKFFTESIYKTRYILIIKTKC